METKLNLITLLEFVQPAYLNYQEWLNVGMALKYEGYTASDWDNCSKSDSRYKPGECFKKWTTFEGNGIPVTGATITQMAKDNGWTPKRNHDDSRELGWDEAIGGDQGYVVIDRNWVEGKEVREPSTANWNPVQELIRYIKTLFDSSENARYVTETYEIKDEKTDDVVRLLGQHVSIGTISDRRLIRTRP